MSYQRREIRFGFGPMGPATKTLLIANAVCFIFGLMLPVALVTDYLLLTREAVFGGFRIYQLITYGFIYPGAALGAFIFTNLTLFFLGSAVEQGLGSKRFYQLYFIAILGGGLFSLAPQGPPIAMGASAGTFAIFAAFAFLWPDRELLFMFFFPMRAKYLFAIYIILGLLFFNAYTFINLGGLIFGAAFLYWIIFRRRADSAASKVFAGWQERKRKKRLAKKQAVINRRIEMHQRVDELLAKISEHGIGSLTKEERKFLDRASAELNNDEIEPIN